MKFGKSKPNVETLIKLADYFHCSTDYLLGRTNNPEEIKTLTKQDLENLDLINKYKSLTIENQNHLKSYLDHLSNVK